MKANFLDENLGKKTIIDVTQDNVKIMFCLFNQL